MACMATTDTQRDAIRQALRSWRRRADSVATDRNPLVVAAMAAGLTKEEIHILTGLGRTTIDRITK